VPFTLGEDAQAFKAISGLACPGRAIVGGAAFEEAVLFTHRGLSGPAILQVSSYWSPGDAVSIEFLANAAEILRAARQKSPRSHLRAALSEHLPNRLAEVLAAQIGLGKELGNTPDTEIERAATLLGGFSFHPSGTEGFAKAEVTVGGIATAELSSRSMESRSVPGLYAIGEAVDVTGWLGGYNFQWAWSSAVAAGQAIAERASQL